MGLEIVEGLTAADWPKYMAELISDKGEMARRHCARERVKLYRDDFKNIITWDISQVFTETTVRQRLERLIPLVGGTSFLKRVADELGRPLYAVSPQRRIVMPDGTKNDEAQAAWNAMAEEMDLDAKMDTVARLITPCAAVFPFVRYIDGLGMQLDIVTPDMITVRPHPEVPTRALAIAYAKKWKDDKAIEHVVWDDKRYFSIDDAGHLIGAVKEHNFGVIPFVEIHLRGRTCHYWQGSVGEDLVSQAKQSMFLDLVVTKKVKTQSHIQLVYSGDMAALVKDQIVDEESILLAGQGGSLTPIDLQSDPMAIVNVKLTNEAAVGANYGLSRERLNQTGGAGAEDGLRERVAELAKVMVPAERRIFDLVRRLSAEYPKYRGKIPEDAVMLLDLGQIHNRVDRKTLLEIRQTERSMGLRSGIDDVLEDNPEMGGDRTMAAEHIDERMAEEAIIIERRRALNMAEDASSATPGQSPEKNGAMGPMVRDGKKTKDEAAAEAEGGVEYQQ